MHSKRKPLKKNEKATHRLGENLCKRSNQQGITLQNIQTSHIALYQKTKQPNLEKWSEDVKRHFSKDRPTDGQKAHEKMFNITNY